MNWPSRERVLCAWSWYRNEKEEVEGVGKKETEKGIFVGVESGSLVEELFKGGKVL